MNAFTCTSSYAILILTGIKRTENRSAWPSPSEGRAAISCSKSFCKEEYGQFIAWASVNLPPEDLEKLPVWREVKDWRMFWQVPMQDFSEPRDGAKQYKKHKLTKEKIVFIESMIKPME